MTRDPCQPTATAQDVCVGSRMSPDLCQNGIGVVALGFGCNQGRLVQRGQGGLSCANGSQSAVQLLGFCCALLRLRCLASSQRSHRALRDREELLCLVNLLAQLLKQGLGSLKRNPRADPVSDAATTPRNGYQTWLVQECALRKTNTCLVGIPTCRRWPICTRVRSVIEQKTRLTGELRAAHDMT